MKNRIIAFLLSAAMVLPLASPVCAADFTAECIVADDSAASAFCSGEETEKECFSAAEEYSEESEDQNESGNEERNEAQEPREEFSVIMESQDSGAVSVWLEWSEIKDGVSSYTRRYRFDTADGTWHNISPQGEEQPFGWSGVYALEQKQDNSSLYWYIEVDDTGVARAGEGYHLDPQTGKYRYYLKAGETAELEGTFQGAPAELYHGAEGSLSGRSGLVTIEGKTRYLEPDGTLFKNGNKKIGSKVYCFDKKGSLTRSYTYVKPGWIKKNGKYYWRLEDGTIYKKKGLWVVNNKKYYLNADGSRVVKAWKKMNGKYYYFQSSGVMYTKKGWFDVNGSRYYVNSDGSCKTGFQTISKKKYYFGSTGKLYRNKRAIKIGTRYYNIDGKGIVTSMSEAQAKCSLETQKFIEQHTRPGMSNSEKFRACYNYLLAYMHYRPKPFNSKDFVGKDWPYNRALSVFQSYLTGNCYGFACCVASCARELGYEPYVIVTTGDHGFVMIDGKYYDNMGALFGASSHFSYNTLYKVKF